MAALKTQWQDSIILPLDGEGQIANLEVGGPIAETDRRRMAGASKVCRGSTVFSGADYAGEVL